MTQYSPLSNCRRSLIDREFGSPPDIGNLGGGNKLKWVDTCETSLNWGVSNRFGGIAMSLIAKIK